MGNNQFVLVGISQTNNPAGAYNLFGIRLNVNTNGFNHNSHSVDFDVTGFDPNNVIITVNVFSTTVFIHSDVYIINKAKLISGGTLVYNTDFRIVHNPCSTVGTNINFAPCVTYGQTSGNAENFVIDNGWYDSGNLTVRYFRVARITGTGASATYDCMGDANFVETSGCYNFNISSAAQPSGCNAIDVGDYRISSPGVVRNGKIWFAHNVGANIPGCASPASSPAATKCEIQWVQQDPASIVSPGLPDQQGRISDSVQAYYFPSIAVNSCNAALVGFTGSGPNAGQFAAGMYTGRLASDSPNTMQSVNVLKAGEDTYRKNFGGPRNRWGDYSATTVDPVDDSTFWTVQEYARPHSGAACGVDTGRWGTWWGAVPIACCPTIDINPASLPTATIGSPYSQTLTATAGTPSFTFTLQSGSLPPGITLSPGGLLSGTPSTTAGSFNCTIKVTDAAGCVGTRDYSIAAACSLPGDVNLNGFIDGDDIRAWSDCAVSGSTSFGHCGCADMNGNGSTDLIVDLPLFIGALGV